MNSSTQEKINVDIQSAHLLIPVYNSDLNLLDGYLEELRSVTPPLLPCCDVDSLSIVLFDDGSRYDHSGFSESDEPYAIERYDHLLKLAEKYDTTLLRHPVNKGKGASLKDGFHFLYKMMSFEYSPQEKSVQPETSEYSVVRVANRFHAQKDGVLTLDSDGQHSVKDVIRITKEVSKQTEKMILFGARDFSASNVPFKSRFGNILTRNIMRAFHGISLQDTQTGLRFIPTKLLPEMAAIDGSRYEYETNQLIHIAHKKLPFEEILIDTIYIDENKGSHFRPIKDSLRIYSLIFGSFVKFLLSSVSSAIIDFALFFIFIFLMQDVVTINSHVAIFTATALARICSAIWNFSVNRKFVFGHKGSLLKSVVEYTALALVIAGASATLVSILWHILGQIKNAQLPIKIVVDCVLFLLSYLIQKYFIFPARLKKKSRD